ncbi:MAG: hypothetical protein ACREOU_16980 [Candidatus Eiseniibacteriota bacterium]
MDKILWLAGALAVLCLLGPVIYFLIAVVFGKTIGAIALAQQPDRIHLMPAGPDDWKNRAKVEETTHAIAALGFADAGTWHISEMPGVIVRLMHNPSERALAALYEHPMAGVWFDFCWRFEDRTSATWTTARSTGLSERPGHPMVHAPGQTPSVLFERARRERPDRRIEPVSNQESKHVFEEAYAESTAWRKAQGISRAEVVKVASRKAA